MTAPNCNCTYVTCCNYPVEDTSKSCPNDSLLDRAVRRAIGAQRFLQNIQAEHCSPFPRFRQSAYLDAKGQPLKYAVDACAKQQQKW